MDNKILASAKEDIPLYFNDFKAFWDSTTANISDEDLTNCYAATLIYKNWTIALNHIGIKHLDEILLELHEDINASFFHAYFGHYRSSHMHMRSLIELTLQILYFYQHEVEYSQWKNAEFRIKHDELTKYLNKHPNLKSRETESLIINITNNWKLFSKYIHAEAPVYFQTSQESSSTNALVRRDFNIWKSDFLKASHLLNKLMLRFFSDKLREFPTAVRELLLLKMNPEELSYIGFVS